MLSIFLSACVLVAVTMAVHAAGITVLVQVLMRLHPLPPTRAWPTIRLLLRMIWWLILLHLAEISVWGLSAAEAHRCGRAVLRARWNRSGLYNRSRERSPPKAAD